MNDTDRTQSLPESLRPYFWDVKFEELEVQPHAFLIIERLLDRGNTHDIRWLLTTYTQEQIKQVILTAKDLSRPTGNLWADTYNLPKEDIPCLQKSYTRIHFGLSS